MTDRTDEEKLDENSSLMIRGVFSLGVSNLVGIIFSFLTITVAARNLSPERFGVYSLIIAIVSLLEVFGNFGLRLSAAKFIASASTRDEQRIIVNNLLTFRLLTVGIISLISYLCKPLFLYFFNSNLLSDLFIFVPIIFTVQNIESTLAFIMQGFKQFRMMAIVQLMSSILNSVLVLIFLLVFHFDIFGFLSAIVISMIVTSLTRFIFIPTPKAIGIDPKLLKNILSFGLPLQGNDMLSFTFQRLDVLILGALIGPSSIAYLDIASKLPNYFKNLFKAFQSVYFPRMSELFSLSQREEAVNVLYTFLRITSMVTMLSAFVFFLFRQELITIVFSEKYLPSTSAAVILMVSAGIGIMSQFLDSSLISAGKPVYILIINLITAVASVAFNLTFIPLFGFVGVAYASFLANLISAPVSYYCLLREKINLRIREPLLPVLLLFTFIGIYYLLNNDNFFIKIFFIALFCLMSYIFSVVTRLDLNNLLHVINGMRSRTMLGKLK